MGGVWYIIIGLILFGLNFGLVYFVRLEGSFIVFPGLIYTLLVLSLGTYLLIQVNNLSPVQNVIKKRPKKAKTMVPSRIHEENHAEQYSLAEVEFQKRERESAVSEMIEFVCFLINLLGIQSLLSAISAFVGSKVVPPEKARHYAFIGLYTGLTLIGVISECLIHLRYL